MITDPHPSLPVQRNTRRRHQQIRWLLSSLHDYEFEPETFTGRIVRKAAGNGTKARVTEWRDCGCNHGQDRYGRPHDVCQGAGRVKVDAYTGDRVATIEHVWTFRELLQRDTRMVGCDSCGGDGAKAGRRCEYCEGSGRVAVPGSWLSDPERDRTGSDPVDAVLNTIERRREIGSYLELEAGLAALRTTLEGRIAWRLLHQVYVERLLDEAAVGEGVRYLLEYGLAFLEGWMPDPIVVPAAVRAAERRRLQQLRRVKGWRPGGGSASPQAVKARDREIRRLARDGRSAQWIAREFGLALSVVYEVAKSTKGEA